MIPDNIPALNFVAVVPSDTVDISESPCRSLYVGTGGTVVAINQEGDAITFTSVPSGTFMPIWTKRVNATNTTASNIVALF